MPFHPCPSGCGRFLSADDGHDRCLQCLGFQHAEDAFVDDSCACCGRMSMISLRSRLSFMKGLAPSAATRAGLSASRGSPTGALGDLRVTVRASLPGTPPWTSYFSRSEHPVRLMQELRTATDFALRATKVTARSLGKAMSSMVVQERHLWLNLAEMKDVDKARFFDAPISQAGLFGDTGEGFAQQFSAIQQQTEAIQHTCPGVMHHPPLPPGPGLSPPVAVGTLLRPPELLAPGRIDTLAGASSLSQESGAPRVPVRPQVVQEVDEVGCAVGAACTASGGVAHAAQPVSLAHAHNSTRLRDSVRQATSQVQRRSRDAGGSPERPGLARGDCCPPGKGRNRAGPSSQKEAGVLQPLLHRTQETWWPSTNPGSASYEPGFTQAPSRCGHAGALSNASSPRIGLQRSTWRMLTTCFDPSATQTVPTVCVWRSGIAVQDPPLRAHEGRRKAPLPRYGRWASGSSTTSTIGLS